MLPGVRAGRTDHDDAEPGRGQRREGGEDPRRPRQDEGSGASQLCQGDEADEGEAIWADARLSRLDHPILGLDALLEPGVDEYGGEQALTGPQRKVHRSLLGCSSPPGRMRQQKRDSPFALRRPGKTQGQRTDKLGSVASALFSHTVLSYQNAAGGRYTPPRRGI